MSADAARVQQWLTARIAELVRVDPATLTPDAPFVAFGMSSLQAVELSDDLQRWTGLTLSPTFAYDHPTIAEAVSAIVAASGNAAVDQPESAPVPEIVDNDAIAIVGIGCRFPGGGDGPQQLWRVFRDGIDAVTEVPADRWDTTALTDENPRWGGFLADVEGFDAEFFGIAAREAARMDPQQRIVLEVAWNALEDAGLGPRRLAGTRTGVFIGASTYDHGAAVLAPGTETASSDGTGSALSVIANRLSYCLDLGGPSMTVDTACSSSLVAVHLACRSLRSGESDLAMAGGVNIVASPRIAQSFGKGSLMAPDGRCKPFDERADGYVRSEGAGVVVLKTLARARRDGDRVYAVIRGSAVNQDGRTNGLIAPSRPAQERVLRSAYRDAGVDPALVTYVEAHGTGTAVGDPIEVGALATVLAADRPDDRPLRIGSAKSNLGHTEAAAGIAGLIKTALALHNRTLPRTLHFQTPNPRLELHRVAVRVQEAAEPLASDETAFAGVSSFGFGGTNAHVVLATAPADAEPATEPVTGPAAETVLFPLSARSERGLRRRARALARLAADNVDDPSWPARAAAAAALRGDHDLHRACVVAGDIDELIDGLTAIADGERTPGVCGPATAASRIGRIGLVFPGQGSQWAGMGKRLAAAVPAFDAAIRRCDAEIAPLLGESLWSAEHGIVANGTAQVQPALFAMQVALAQMWREFGIEPSAVCGHSMGEIAAAQVSGALSLADAALLASTRSRLLTEISGAGGLALVELDEQQVHALLDGYRGEVSLAAVNGPRALVLSGPPDALDTIVRDVEAEGGFARRISVEFAAHSPAVEPLQPRLRAGLAGLTPRVPEVPMYSTVTGAVIEGAGTDAQYWSRNLRETVRFADALTRLRADGHDILVEIAPHPVLERSIAELAGPDAVVIASSRRDEDELRAVLSALGQLYVHGAAVDWTALYSAAPALPIPSQGWNHQRFPLVRPAAGGDAAAVAGRLLGARIPVVTQPGLALWPLPIDAVRTPEIADHVVDGVPVVPGAYWLAAVTAAAAEVGADGYSTTVVSNVRFEAPYVATAYDPAPLQLAMERVATGYEFSIASRAGNAVVVHARGGLGLAGEALGAQISTGVEELRRRCDIEVPLDEFYERFERMGLRYGPLFRAVTRLARGSGQAIGRFELPEGLPQRSAGLHPALLDACLHTIAAAADAELPPGVLPLPSGAGRVHAANLATPPSRVWCHARLIENDEHGLTADLVILTDDDTVVWSAQEFRVTKTAARAVDTGRVYRVGLHEHDPGSPDGATGAWLILGADTAISTALADRLAAAGDHCVVGSPSGTDDYESLVAELDSGAAGPIGIIDARAFGPVGADPATAAEHALGTVELLRFVAARTWRGAPPRLWVLTANTQHAADENTVAAAALHGLARVIAAEHRELRCSTVDLPAEPNAAQLAHLVSALRDGRTPQQLVVHGGTATPRLRPAPRTRTRFTVTGDHICVITGGLGALGLRVAEWASGRGARNLLLLGRGAPDQDAVERIEELRARGVRVAVAAVDVADADALATILTRHRPIGAVFHLAGVLEDGVVDQIDASRMHRALAGKAGGAWNLHRATLDDPIEHFVLFSSLAGLFGSPGQGAYAAANTYLDALAGARAANGLPAKSIAFGPWAQIGLASAAGSADRLAGSGVPPLDPDIAMELLEAALSDPEPLLAVAAFDPARFTRSGLPPAAAELLSELLPDAPAEPVDTSVADALAEAEDPVVRAGILRTFVLGQVAAILGTSRPVDPDLPFQELGFDSLMAVELRNRLESALGRRLSAGLVYAHPTAARLADGLLDDATAATGPAQPAVADDLDDELSDLTDDELAQLLAAELDT
ncbi:type I polyketide synthase [Nocardia cyriacigeorgica]|uniref:type I polyketide synthase n=1 Tax=Nocardia cyriacigeorgica TaxID=135487 RepID=UPI0024570BFD|nr:type I polyketide synthase [Nocardia cyriacigeorgica]